MDHTPSGLRLDAEDPWPGLAAYDEASQRFFHGREADSVELLRLIRLSPYVGLYGKSGLGKSSMLQAGLFPQLRAERFLPVHLRLDYTEKAGQPLLPQIASRLREEVETAGADAPPLDAGENLWAYLQRREWPIWTADNYRLTPVLVFDQFEEVFSRGGSPEHVKAMLELMADLVGDRLPAPLAQDRNAVRRLNLQSQQYRVVLSFRSDFLAEVEAWEKHANLPRRESLHLTAMSRERAIEAIELSGKAVLEPGVAERIVDFLLNREGRGTSGRATEVEPVLLSLSCYQLNNRRKRPAKIDATLLSSVGEGILKGFYVEALVGLRPTVSQFIEENLIQGERYRNSYPLDEALASGEMTQHELNTLTERRLLRVDPQGEVPRIELIHDRLVSVVREARDARRALEAQRVAREEAERLAKQEAKAEYDRQRLEQAETERRRVARWRNGLAFVVVLLLAAVGWLISSETRLRKAIEDEKRATALANEKADQAAAALAEVGVIKEVATAYAAQSPNRGPAGVQTVLRTVEEAEEKLRGNAEAPQQAALESPAPPPPPVPIQTEAVTAGRVGQPTNLSTLTYPWRLSSGGCLKGDVTVSGEAKFWLEASADNVIAHEQFEGTGNGFTVKVDGVGAAVPRSPKGYEIQTRGVWSGPNRKFQSSGVDRVLVGSDGSLSRAIVVKFKTECPG